MARKGGEFEQRGKMKILDIILVFYKFALVAVQDNKR